MRFSTVLVTSSLILSGFAAAQRFGDYDLYSRSFDADALAELHARSYVDDDVGLYLRSVMAEGADAPSPDDATPEQSGAPTEDPSATPQSDVAAGAGGAYEHGPKGHGGAGPRRGGGKGGKGGHRQKQGGGRHGQHGHNKGEQGKGHHPHPGGNRHGKGGAMGGQRRHPGRG